MIQLTVPAALAIILFWPLGIWFTTWKYLKAYAAGQKHDAIIWFCVWGIIIAMVEWFALACYVIVQSALSVF